MTIEMLSPRTAIRQAAVGILRETLPGWVKGFAAGSIYDSLTVPLGMKRLPAVLVYTNDERLEDDGGHADPGLRSRVLELAVEVLAGTDALTDFFCAAVEAVMDNNETLGNLAQGTRLRRISADRDSDGEKTMVAAKMEFDVAYFTRPVVAPISDAAVESGIAYAPVYPAGSSAILGMTPTLAELEENGEGLFCAGQPLQILTSTTPFVGPGYEPHYEPAPTT